MAKRIRVLGLLVVLGSILVLASQASAHFSFNEGHIAQRILHKPLGQGQFQPADPVNIVFVHTNYDEALADFARNVGWEEHLFGAGAHLEGHGQRRHLQSDQRMSGSTRPFGVGDTREHIRFWDCHDVDAAADCDYVVAAVHHDRKVAMFCEASTDFINVRDDLRDTFTVEAPGYREIESIISPFHDTNGEDADYGGGDVNCGVKVHDYDGVVYLISVAPTPPSDLEVAFIPSRQAQLSWHDNSEIEDGFRIERNTEDSGDCGEWEVVATVGSDVTSIVVAATGDLHFYRVRAFNSHADDLTCSNTVAVNPLEGFIYASGFGDGGIFKVDTTTGHTTQIATLGFAAEDMVLDSDGILYIGGITTGVKRIDTNTFTVLPDVGTNICGPEGASVHLLTGDIYFNTRLTPCDHSGVWKIPGGTATTAEQVMPPHSDWGEGTTFVNLGLLVSDLLSVDSPAGRIMRSSFVDLLFNNPPHPFVTGLDIPLDVAVDTQGRVYVSEHHTAKIKRFDGDGNFIDVFASGFAIGRITFMEFDAADNLYIAEHDTGELTKIAPDGSITTLTTIDQIVGLAIAPP